MGTQLARFLRSVWFFPAVLFLVVCLLTICRISGSSVGMYNKFFYGPGYHDKNLLFGEPRSVRSDEWLVVTPMTVSQKNNGLQKINKTIGNGQDMSAVSDTPHRTWDALFSPQNWSFFLLPLEFAFAFKWWFIGFLLITSCYFFVLTFLPRRRLLAALLGLAAFFAPYMQWWYQSINLLVFAYGFLAITCFVHLLRSQTSKQRLGWAAGLTYTLTALIFLQYPPYILPVFATVIAVGAGYCLEEWRSVRKTLRQVWPYAAGVVVAVVLMCGLLFATRWHALSIMAHTEYPGKRAPETLDLTWPHLFGGFLSNQLQDTTKAMHYISNQSESSNFIMIAPFLLLPSAWLLYHSFRRRGQRRYTLLFLNILLVLFCIRVTVEVSGSSSLAELVRIVPNTRILYGVGFVAFIQFVILARDQEKAEYPKWVTKGGTWLTFLALAFVGFVIRHQYHGYIVNGSKILVLAAAMAVLYRLFVTKRLALAALLLLAMSFYATYRVNPLYRGLEPLTNSPLTHAVSSVNAKRPGAWIVVDSLEYNTYLQAAGIRTISGDYQYPQLDLWHELDPTGKYKTVYNRYAQVIFSQGSPTPFYLVQNDWFNIKFDGCSPFVQQKSRYIMSVQPITGQCLTPVKTVTFPAKAFYIYETGNGN